jgi:hypothetical protein
MARASKCGWADFEEEIRSIKRAAFHDSSFDTMPLSDKGRAHRPRPHPDGSDAAGRASGLG